MSWVHLALSWLCFDLSDRREGIGKFTVLAVGFLFFGMWLQDMFPHWPLFIDWWMEHTR